MFKELFHKAYPKGSQEEKIRQFCAETGYGRSVVHEWLAGTAEPRPIVTEHLKVTLSTQESKEP